MYYRWFSVGTSKQTLEFACSTNVEEHWDSSVEQTGVEHGLVESSVFSHGFGDWAGKTVLEFLYVTEFSPRMTVGFEIKGKVISGDTSSSGLFNSWHTFKPRKTYQSSILIVY